MGNQNYGYWDESNGEKRMREKYIKKNDDEFNTCQNIAPNDNVCVFLSNFRCIELFIMSMYATNMRSEPNYDIEDSIFGFHLKIDVKLFLGIR